MRRLLAVFSALTLAMPWCLAVGGLGERLGLRPSAEARGLLERLEAMPAAARLDTVALWCNTREDYASPDDPLALYAAYVTLADSLADVQSGYLARHDMLVVLSDQRRRADVLTLAPEFMGFLLRAKQYEGYFDVGIIKIRKLLDMDDVGRAIQFADTLHYRASRLGNAYGLACVAEARGEIFFSMDDVDRARVSFAKALRLIGEAEGRADEARVAGKRHSILDSYAFAVAESQPADTLLGVCRAWLARIAADRKTFGRADGYNEVAFRNHTFSAMLHMAGAFVRLGMADSARATLRRCRPLIADGDDVCLNLWLQASGNAALADGDAGLALSQIDSALCSARRNGDTRGYFSLMAQKKTALAMLGRHDEAAALADSVLEFKIRQTSELFSSQISLAERFRDRARDRQAWLGRALWVVGFLAVAAAALVVLYVLQLRRNRRLYLQIEESAESEAAAEKTLSDKPGDLQTPDERLYLRLCALMADERLYTDPDLDREALAARAGSNYLYVSNAIRSCAEGITVGAFINRYRLREAARLLAQTDRPIVEVGEMSGFNSRSTFSRVFAEEFKMSPRDYRKAARQEVV